MNATVVSTITLSRSNDFRTIAQAAAAGASALFFHAHCQTQPLRTRSFESEPAASKSKPFQRPLNCKPVSPAEPYSLNPRPRNPYRFGACSTRRTRVLAEPRSRKSSFAALGGNVAGESGFAPDLTVLFEGLGFGSLNPNPQAVLTSTCGHDMGLRDTGTGSSGFRRWT